MNCKRCFPFRLAAPSYIYPGGYIANVKRLGPGLDEIELLLFEGDPQSLPSAREVSELALLAGGLNITYNIHLPLDIDLTSPDASERRQAVDSMARVIELVRPLQGTTHTLHLPAPKSAHRTTALHAWQTRALQSLERLFRLAPVASAAVSIETLDYPPQWFAPIVQHMNLAVCVDVGHVIYHGFDLQAILRNFEPRITIIHLHGVADGKDHLGLDRLDTAARRIIGGFLSTFRGSLSLEVFSHQRLMESLKSLAVLMNLPRTVA